jgi:alginate O-acetyltransferase complex protein AlgI
MLFNSYFFIFLFLPITLLGFHLLGGRLHHRLALVWLVAASLFFYGWWNPTYLGLIIASILGNYAFGIFLAGAPNRLVLAAGVAVNLSLLGYFKYANFFAESLALAAGADWRLSPIVLPLALSFFTFQQIAYLVDTYQGRAHEYGFLRYCLFVTFFPQLIAGPIVHHKEMLPQFARKSPYRLKGNHLAVGLTIFAIGLFKKTVIADGMAIYATPVFDAALAGQSVGLVESWGGALAYTFQLYFDFSGYSDMAVGLARMFGIRFPVNFNSPYKADSIIDFWRRWHMTLSRFLRDYLYIPLGGNQRRWLAVMVTMLLGGLWHGAGWTFVAWGGLHGFYLIINYQWRRARGATGARGVNPAGRWAGRGLTFCAVVVGWVLFRAESWDASLVMLSGMMGLNGLALESDLSNINWRTVYPLLACLLIVVWMMPNTYQFLSRYRPVLEDSRLQAQLIWRAVDFKWRLTTKWAYVSAFIAAAAISMLTRVSEFLYFQF